MALYAIGDLHLSLGSDKPMDVFGGAWVGYVDKLREGLSVIGPEDTTVLLGDLSWALDLNGARGWFFEEDAPDGSHNDKIFKRELLRLEASLRAAGDTPEKLCFLHYPPRYRGYECPEILALLERYGVKECCYGHLHGSSHRLAIEGVHHGVTYRLCAADYTNFAPIRLR